MDGHCSRLSSTVRVGASLACYGLLVLTGCSSQVKVVPVEGKITVSDGKPTPKGHVVFVPIVKDPNLPPKVSSPAGFIGEGGVYALTWNGQPGAPVGKYRIAFQRSLDGRWSVVPAEYFDPEKTPLELEVVENKPEGGYDLTVPAQSEQAQRGPRDLSFFLKRRDEQRKKEMEKQSQEKQ